jgi:pimeloyl-ACP methyl ester carboxylesterase
VRLPRPIELGRRIARLGRWLGPWSDEQGHPPSTREEIAIEPDMRAWVYRPVGRPPLGAVLVVPGLHYLGPSDPRLDRFCRILAFAGNLVLCPFLPDFSRLRVGPDLGPDTGRALDALLALHDRPREVAPGVLSISFGSRPAVEIAATRPEVGNLVLFGGFADFREAIRFCIAGAPDPGRAHDPLNRPVVYLNLLEHLDPAPSDPESFSEACFEYVRQTWGKPEMKPKEAFAPVAQALAEELTDAELFLQATGVAEGGVELGLAALERAGHHFEYLDPEPWLSRVRVPVTVIHGREDDVIPFEHAERLASMAPRSRHLVTGIYAHTGRATLAELIPEAAQEGSAMVQILVQMARTGFIPATSGSH